jgi:TPR repeat protein
VKAYLAQSSFGRILLHVACAWRDHKYQWHWLGIRRELSANQPVVRRNLCNTCAIIFLVFGALAEPGFCENARVKATRARAAAGDARAQFQLGRIYEFGEGVQADSATAVKWYRKAAEQDLPQAQCNLARMYESGEGVEQNWLQAAQWLCKAADAYCLPAMNRLGVMCERGQGVPQDYIEAYKWYARAAEEGYLSAVVNRDNLRPRMTRHQIAEAERLALENSRSRLATSNRH